MAIGLKFSNKLRIDLGEIKEELLAQLDEAEIEYSIPFDKVNKQNFKETIIDIKGLGIEITTENDIINYIKSNGNEYTIVDTIEKVDSNVLKHLSTIQDKVYKFFDSSKYNIKMEKIDIKALNMTFLLYSDDERARVQIIRDTAGKVFINTIMRLS